jgi:hypothetical protein
MIKKVFLATVMCAVCMVWANVTFPDNPPTVSGGELTKGGNMANAAVTQSNLDDFIETYLGTMLGYWWYGNSGANNSAKDNSAQKRQARGSVFINTLPERYMLRTDENRGDIRFLGKTSGITEVEFETYLKEAEFEESRYFIAALKYFDFSQTDLLFLGGAVGYLEKSGDEYSTENGGIQHTLYKANGIINFSGKYQGRLVFDNVVISRKLQLRIENGYHELDTLEHIITSGRFFVESNGHQIDISTDIPVNLLYDFIVPEAEIDYGDKPIDRAMPAVPNAPSGMLSNRGGETVNSANLERFLQDYISDFRESRFFLRQSRGMESVGREEWISRGMSNGYASRVENRSRQISNSADLGFHTATSELFDFSNRGDLFLGGGYGEAGIVEYALPSSDTWWYRDDYKLNGRVDFNGKFAGTIEYDNFHYSSGYYWSESVGSYSRNILLGGRVMLDALDITAQYMTAMFGDDWERSTSINRNNSTINRSASLASFAGIRNGQINLNLQAGNYTAELYNLQGRMVGRVNITAISGVNATGLQTDNLARGVFILNVRQADGISVLRQRISVR